MTDAIPSAALSQAAVSGALKKASEKTGVGFDYLYRVAMRESSLNPQARAKTSSAAGLFQFIEQTWLGAVKKYGAQYGLEADAAAISTNEKGRLFVSDPAKRVEILEKRFDAEIASALAGELARENRQSLEAALGRAVDGAELYAAHFLGAGGAKKLLSAATDQSAAALLPQAASANAHVFYDGERARTVGEVIDSFRRTIGAAETAIRDIGALAEKSFRPALRETAALRDLARAAFAPEKRQTGFEVKSLSPLILTVLQALDPRELIGRDDADRR